MQGKTVPQVSSLPHTTSDPTGLRYDRGDLDDTPTAAGLPAGLDGWAVTGRNIAGQRYDSPAAGRQLNAAPAVLVMPAFDLRELRERHVTAVDLERGAA